VKRHNETLFVKEIGAFTCVQLINSRGYNDHESQQLGVRECVLHARRPFHVPAVDERQYHWKTKKKDGI